MRAKGEIRLLMTRVTGESLSNPIIQGLFCRLFRKLYIIVLLLEYIQSGFLITNALDTSTRPSALYKTTDDPHTHSGSWFLHYQILFNLYTFSYFYVQAQTSMFLMHPIFPLWLSTTIYFNSTSNLIFLSQTAYNQSMATT